MHETTTVGPFRLSFHEAPDEIEASWSALYEQGIGSFFQSHAWCDTWCRVAAPRSGETPLIVVGWFEDQTPAFVLPLATRRRLGTLQLGWLSQDCAVHKMGLYHPRAVAALDAAALGAILRAVAARRPGCAFAHFRGQPADWDGHPNPFASLPGYGRSQYQLEAPIAGDYESVLHERFTGRTLSSHRRRARMLAEAGARMGLIAGDTAERQRIFNAFSAQKSGQLGAKGFENVYERPELAEFYRALMAAPGAGEKFRVLWTTHGDAPVACVIGVVDRGRYYNIMLSMAESEVSRYSPGLLLFADAVRDALALGVDTVDFGPGWSQLKESWKAERHERFDTFLAVTPLGIPAASYVRVRQVAETRIRANPKVFALAKRVLKALRGHAGRRPAPTAAKLTDPAH